MENISLLKMAIFRENNLDVKIHYGDQMSDTDAGFASSL